jgi:Mg-chelatase subunit ChlD
MGPKHEISENSGGDMFLKERSGSTAKDTTEIICIIDRSGSMESIRSDAIGGFNRFLADQQAPDDPARLTMVLFDDQYEIVHDGTDIRNVRPLTTQTFVPRGTTALLDAIGRTLNTVSARLADIPAGDRPEKVIVVILTDGYENASREFSLAAVRKMITTYTDELKWDFIYLAANQNAFAESAKMGIAADNTMQFFANSDGCSRCYDNFSSAIDLKRKYNNIRAWKGQDDNTKRGTH